MEYRCEATSVEGFIQQLACNYLPHGYWFWVSGVVPEKKDPAVVDKNLMEKYQIGMSRQQRARRKAAGFANIHYLRFLRFWIMVATHGKHRWFSEHTRIEIDKKTNEETIATLFHDVRKAPINFAGYSISYKQGFMRQKRPEPLTIDQGWHSRVQIGREKYAELKAYYLSEATRRSCQSLGRELYNLPYEPYAPVRQQLLNLLRLINEARHAAGLEQVGTEVLRYRRRIVKPFLRAKPSTAQEAQDIDTAFLVSAETA